MDTFYCLISSDLSKENPANLGWAYCLAHQSEWIKNDEIISYDCYGMTLGCVFVVHNNVAYDMHKIYTDVDNNRTVILCKESIRGCDRI